MSVVTLETSGNQLNGFVKNIYLFFNHKCLVMSLTIVIIEISILEFVKMQSFVQNQKSLTLVPKNVRFSCF